MLDSRYYSASFCVVGLHLLHVFVGALALMFLLKCFELAVSSYRPTLVVWYWHFVDYVWLIVYLFVYVL